jgi:N-acetylneuraminate synthase/N,N'-diacetyllegionaminate synthase
MKIEIGNKLIGEEEPCFIIAEAGVNHNGDAKLAMQLIDAAKDAGADAVKFQTFKTENLLSKNIVVPKHVESKESLFDTIRGLELSEEAHYMLSEYCKQKGIVFMSTPMDNNSVDLLEDIGVPVFKVASCDLDNLPLLKYISKTEKPIILSTGMGSISEVGEAIEVIKSNGNSDIILLHCVSAYPPKVEDVNLRAMETLENAFKLTVGYSDHTIGINIPLAAVALGAKVIEKHFTLDKNMEGPDHAVSADPDDLERLVSGIREIEESFGTGVKIPSKDEIEMRRSFRKSIVAIADIKKGATIMPEMLSVKRPGTGISPKYFDFVAGRKAERDLSKDDLITMDDF